MNLLEAMGSGGAGVAVASMWTDDGPRMHSRRYALQPSLQLPVGKEKINKSRHALQSSLQLPVSRKKLRGPAHVHCAVMVTPSQPSLKVPVRRKCTGMYTHGHLNFFLEQ